MSEKSETAYRAYELLAAKYQGALNTANRAHQYARELEEDSCVAWEKYKKELAA